MSKEQFSKKSRLVAILLCWFLGIVGAHRFYAGKNRTAVAMIVTGGGAGIWMCIDFVFLVLGKFKDIQGKRIYYWLEKESLLSSQ